mgnify:CR=1 FL=1
MGKVVAVEFLWAVITAYGVYAMVLVVGSVFMRLRLAWQEVVEALGGLLWLPGLTLWRLTGCADVSLLLQSAGVALMLLPHLAGRVIYADKS